MRKREAFADMSKKPGMRDTLFGAVSISSLAMLQSVPAWAQDDDAARLDTVIVTGTKQNLSLQDVEFSVDIFNEKRLEEENLFDLDDVLGRVPNVTTSTTTATLSIRGISRFGVGNAGQGVTSNVYLDGAPIATQALTSGFDSVWDVGQVDVLRGPQSTVQGRNALAGAVVLRTNDPTYDWEYKFRARYGNADTQQYAGVISGPIIDQQVAFRLAADYQSTDGFTTNAFSQEDDASRDNILVRGKLLLEPNALPDLHAELIVDYNDANSRRLGNSIAPIVNIESPEVLDFDFDSGVNFFKPIRNENEIIRFLADIYYDQSGIVRIRGLVDQDTGDLVASAVASEIRPDPRTYGIVLDVAF